MALFLFLAVMTAVYCTSCEKTDDTNSRRNDPIVTGREARQSIDQSIQDMHEKAVLYDTTEDLLFQLEQKDDSNLVKK